MYIEKNTKFCWNARKSIIHCPRTQRHSHRRLIFRVFIRDLFLIPQSLGTSSHLKTVCLGHMAMWRDWEPSHQDCKEESSWDDQPVGDGRNGGRTQPLLKLSTRGWSPRTLCFGLLLLLGFLLLHYYWKKSSGRNCLKLERPLGWSSKISEAKLPSPRANNIYTP